MEFCKALLVSAVATLAIGVSSAAAAASPIAGQSQVSMDMVGAEQGRQRAIEFAMAPIKSADDLAAYLRTAGTDSPLMALSPGARERFLGSLSFNANGLVSYQYEDLARELTASQAYRLLALFGAQRTTHLVGARVEDGADEAVAAKPRVPQLRADHAKYKCVSPHNCYYSEFFICLTGC